MGLRNGTTVVVGIDGSHDSDRALRCAAALVNREGLALRLVHVVSDVQAYAPMGPYISEGLFAEIGEQVLNSAEKLALELHVRPDRLSTVLTHGSRAAALVDHLEDACVVVLGPRGSAIEHLLTGSTTTAVIAHSSLPVLCVPQTWSEERPSRDRIVVGVDGTDVTPVVLRAAFTEAAARGGTLDIVHAWRPDSPYDAAIEERTVRPRWEKETRRALTTMVEDIATDFADVEWNLTLRYEHVPVALHAAALDADLLVLGRRGHRTHFSVFVGSTTRTLLRAASGPLLVVPVPFEPPTERVTGN